MDASARFVMKMFSKHYRESHLVMPDRFSRREFGFMFFDRSFVLRHIAFANQAQLKKYLVENVPSHVYYSSAYYEKPAAPTMQEKNWLGADLIFDLDADHVRGAEKLTYEAMLDKVKQEVARLLDDFILGDMGFGVDETRVVFSGGRGFHVHISHPSVLRLNSHQRREIVDYITGTGLDIDFVFPRTPFELKRYGDKIVTKPKRRMVKTQDGGWQRRIRRGIDGLFADMEMMSSEQQMSQLRDICSQAGLSVSEKMLQGLHDELLRPHAGVRGIDRMRREDNFEVFKEDKYLNLFLDIVIKKTAVDIAGETDEPVTSDIKRLIRLPSSLHGKTGFEVVPMTREELDSFNPFADAVPKAFGNRPVTVVCEKPVQVRLKGDSYSLDQGQNDVPEYVAVHLVCRRLAKMTD